MVRESCKKKPKDAGKSDHFKSLDEKYKDAEISDDSKSLEKIEKLRKGHKSSKLILGIDFTKSNERTGKVSFNNRNLHTIGTCTNPYEQAISIIEKTWAPFGDDILIPCFGFGDAITKDQEVFSFDDYESPCCGFRDVLTRYRRIAQCVKLGGSSSFAPIIEAAIDIVEKSGGEFHVLVIIADGQVTRSVDTSDNALSPQEVSIGSILNARSYPLSIIVVGVGDGPWDSIKELVENISIKELVENISIKELVQKIPPREFDFFQFINFTKIMNNTMALSKKEALFAFYLLMETTKHFEAAIKFGVHRKKTGKAKKIMLRPPPTFYVHHAATKGKETMVDKPCEMNTLQDVCPICHTNGNDMVFGCGHKVCRECGPMLETCYMCRQSINERNLFYYNK